MPTQKVLNKIVTKKDEITTVYKIGDVIEGYYDSASGKFYEESTHVTEIEGASGFIYIDLADNGLYIYKESTSSFVSVGGGGGTANNIKFGYLNSTDGKFYEDDQYTIEIAADPSKIYVDLADDMIYRYDVTDAEYVAIGGGGGGGNYTAGFGIDIDSNDVISTTDFVGTQAQWNALSAADKAKYDFIHITDDTSSIVYKPGHSISDGTTEKTQRDGLVFEGFEVTDDSTNEVTKITDIPYTAGDGVEITNHEVSVTEDRPATFVGTTQEWDALTATEKAQYKIVNLTNDAVGGDMVVVDVVADGNYNAVSSSAVYNAIHTITPTNFLNVSFTTTETSFPVDLSNYTYLFFYVGYSADQQVSTTNIVDSILIPTNIFTQVRGITLIYNVSADVSITFKKNETGISYQATHDITTRRLVGWGY